MIVALLALLLTGCRHDAPVTAPTTAPQRPTPVSTYQTTASGLQWADTTLGTGAVVAVGDRVEVAYTGWVLGSVTPFDTSYGRNTPFVVPIGTGLVIKGWDEGVVGMRVGGRRQLVIPADLAYGERGAGGGLIPPGATLLFDVEVVAILPARSAPSAPTPCEPIVRTLSGLSMCDVRVGTGEPPMPGQMIRAEYTGWLADGTPFDSSYNRDSALVFPIGEGRVIAGWDEGLATMRVGGRRVLIIPPELAYGAAGHPPTIPEEATLTFEVELVGVVQ